MNPGTDYFTYKISSIALSIVIISISCVLHIPLFPNKRDDNWGSGIFGNIIYFITNCLLLFELNKSGIIQDVRKAVRITVKGLFVTKLNANNGDGRQSGATPRQSVTDLLLVESFHQKNLDDESEPVNYLARGFFVGYLVLHSWRIINGTYFIFRLGECFNVIDFLADISKLFLAIFILISLAFKTKITGERRLSYFTWSLAGAACFSAAFNYIVEEVIWAYVDIIEKSINDPHYGLDIPENITKVEDYIEEIFKLKSICLEHSLGYGSAVMMYLFELIPFSTEYFSLATFFCFVMLANLQPATQEVSASQIKVVRLRRRVTKRKRLTKWAQQKRARPSTQPRILTTDDNPSSNGDNSQTNQNLPPVQLPSNRNFTTILKRAGIIFLLLVTFVYAGGIFVTLWYHNDNLALWLFNIQRILLPLISGGIQCTLYFLYLCKLRPNCTPKKFQLDIILLIFPLIPLAVIFSVGACPDLMSVSPAYTSPRWIQTIFNIGLATAGWLLLAYQVVFITQVLARLHYPEIGKLKHWFHWLVAINLCIWISLAIECKSMTLHSASAGVFGVVNWTILVYSTVPFILFGYAHSAICFWEIANHIGVESYNV